MQPKVGAAIARLFYTHHYKVGIYDINSAQAQQLAASLGPNAKAGQLDVSSYQDWQTALAEFVTWAGELNVLVNNAGILFSGPFEHTEISAHHKTMSINVNGVLNGCHAALPTSNKRILLVSSTFHRLQPSMVKLIWSRTLPVSLRYAASPKA